MFIKSSYTQTSISEWKTKHYNECANEKYETESRTSLLTLLTIY